MPQLIQRNWLFFTIKYVLIVLIAFKLCLDLYFVYKMESGIKILEESNESLIVCKKFSHANDSISNHINLKSKKIEDTYFKLDDIRSYLIASLWISLVVQVFLCMAAITGVITETFNLTMSFIVINTILVVVKLINYQLTESHGFKETMATIEIITCLMSVAFISMLAFVKEY